MDRKEADMTSWARILERREETAHGRLLWCFENMIRSRALRYLLIRFEKLEEQVLIILNSILNRRKAEICLLAFHFGQKRKATRGCTWCMVEKGDRKDM